MLRALDRIAPAKLAIPMGLVAAAGLVGLGIYRPVYALGAGAVLLCGALVLSLSARWRLEGNPDPVTAGVHFEAPSQPAARWIGLLCFVLGGAVLGYGVWDTVNARLLGAWDPMRGALAMTAPGVSADALPSEAPTSDAPATEAPTKTDSKGAAAALGKLLTRRERPAFRVDAAGDVQPSTASSRAPTDALLNTLRRGRNDARAALPALREAWTGQATATHADAGVPTLDAGSPASAATTTYTGYIKKAQEARASGRNGQAIKLLIKAAKMRPDDRKPQELLCAAYEKIGNRKSALKACEAALSRSGDGPHLPALEAKIRKLRSR